MKKFAVILLTLAAASLLVAQPIVSDSRSIDLDGAKVHYTNYGKGETALFFVHGWSCDETVWSEQAAALAEKMRVITIDLPGHGQSDKPREFNQALAVFLDKNQLLPKRS